MAQISRRDHELLSEAAAAERLLMSADFQWFIDKVTTRRSAAAKKLTSRVADIETHRELFGEHTAYEFVISACKHAIDAAKDVRNLIAT